MMKIALLVLVAAVMAVNSSAIAPRSNLNIGWIGARDVLLSRTYVYKPPFANSVQYEDVSYQGPSVRTRITAIQATEIGATQFGSARINQGGIGRNFVTVRFTSSLGRGYYYVLDIWGQN